MQPAQPRYLMAGHKEFKTESNETIYQYLTSTYRGSKKVDYSSILEKSHSEYKRQTKIICTIGHACSSVPTLVEMLDAGMNVARFDFSHGNQFEKSLRLKNLREAMMQRPDKKCATLLDLKGSDIKTNYFVEGLDSIEVRARQSLTIVADPDHMSTRDHIGCSYASLPQSVKIGQ